MVLLDDVIDVLENKHERSIYEIKIDIAYSYCGADKERQDES
jgi:hypothetical protein